MVKLNRLQKSALIAASPLVLGAALLVGSGSPASAQVLTNNSLNDATASLDSLKTGAAKTDDAAKMIMPVSIGTVVFGAGSLLFKRFVYS